MAADIVQAIFSGAASGSDLAAFAPAVGSGFTKHPSFPTAAVATANGAFRVATSGVDVVYFDDTAASSANYNVRVKLTAQASTGGDIAGPVIRCSATSDNFYTFVWIDYNGLGSGLALFKHVNGQPTQVGNMITTLNGASVAPTSGATAVLDIAVAGSTLTGSFNGTTAITLTDSDITATGLGGLYLHSGASTDGSGIQAAEFYVNDPAASAGTASTPSTPTPTIPTPTPVVIGVTSVGHWCSPLNWDDNGGGSKLANGVRAGASTIWSANNGAEGRFSWSTSAATPNVATLEINTSSLIGGSIPPASFPMIKYRVNDGAYHVVQLEAGTHGTWSLDVTAAGVSGAGTYTLRYYLMATSQAQPRWTPVGNDVAPPNSLKVTGLTVDPGSTAVAPIVLGNTLAVFGDSITEGVEAMGTNNGDLVSNDSTMTYVRSLAANLAAEVATVGFGAQGWEHAGGGGVPPFSTAFGFYSAGRPRDFSPTVNYAVCTHGTNDGLNNTPDSEVTTDSAAWLASARSKFGPAAKLFLCVPFGGFKRSALTAGFEQYQAATPDASAFLVDGGPTLQAGLTAFVTGGTWAAPGDGIHPDAPGHARIAATLSRTIDAAVAGTTPVPVPVPTPIPTPFPSNPNVPLQPSGMTFGQLRMGGLSGQIEALIEANPAFDPATVLGLRAGRNGVLDRTYQGLASLVESFLRGDPIATTDVNNRLAEYALVFAGYAQSAGEIAALASAHPGTITTYLATPLATNATEQRSFT